MEEVAPVLGGGIDALVIGVEETGVEDDGFVAWKTKIFLCMNTN
jgi:hypothetical protein